MTPSYTKISTPQSTAFSSGSTSQVPATAEHDAAPRRRGARHAAVQQYPRENLVRAVLAAAVASLAAPSSASGISSSCKSTSSIRGFSSPRRCPARRHSGLDSLVES